MSFLIELLRQLLYVTISIQCSSLTATSSMREDVLEVLFCSYKSKWSNRKLPARIAKDTHQTRFKNDCAAQSLKSNYEGDTPSHYSLTHAPMQDSGLSEEK